MSTDRVVRDGMVAVVHTSSYGGNFAAVAGMPEAMFAPAVVAWVEAGERQISTFPSGFRHPNFNDLMITWVPVGAAFRIGEYDGNEWVELRDDTEWITA